MKGVQLTKLVQELGLHNLTPEIDLPEIVIKTAEINRPALQDIWNTLPMSVYRSSDM